MLGGELGASYRVHAVMTATLLLLLLLQPGYYATCLCRSSGKSRGTSVCCQALLNGSKAHAQLACTQHGSSRLSQSHAFCVAAASNHAHVPSKSQLSTHFNMADSP